MHIKFFHATVLMKFVFPYSKTHAFSPAALEKPPILWKKKCTPFRIVEAIPSLSAPEGTASVVRAYIEHKMYAPPSVSKMFYIGPMFRYERPQAGRLRQFYQIGVEAMGSPSPAVDVEVMTMLIEFFRELGLKDSQLQINSLGNQNCRPKYREILKSAIEKHLDKLCKNCINRL